MTSVKRKNLVMNEIYRVFFFYFGLFDMPIIWSFFGQKLCSWTFFISTLRSYFTKKFGENFFKTLNFVAVFVKMKILRNNGKILFLKFSNFQIFSNLVAKSNFFDSFCLNFNVCTYKRHFFFIFGLSYQKLKKFC